MNDDTDDEPINRYSIERLTLVLDRCEHEELECTDEEANADDLIMLPNAFLRVTERCSEYAAYRLLVDDEWLRDMGETEPDEYMLCPTHAHKMMTDLDPDATLPD
jgi:hypothetical protein